MKNLVVKYINVVSCIILFAFAFPSTLTLNNKEISTKLQIETNLEKKVINVISKIYDVNKFAVTTNVVLLSANQNTNNNQTVQSFGSLELEGILPAVPATEHSGVVLNNDDYRIQIKDITIWLDYELNIINAENQIKQFIFEAMDWLSECESCLQFRSMQFPQSQSSNGESTQPNLSTLDNEDIKIIEENISYLMDQMDKLTEASSSDDVGLSKNEWIIDYLEREKTRLQGSNDGLLSKLLSIQDNVITRDSAIIMETTSGQKEIALQAMEFNSEATQQQQKFQSDNDMWDIIIVCVLIGVIILLVILSNRGPKTVYLKPKNQKKNNVNTQSSDAENDTDNQEDTNNSTKTEESLNQTGAYEDDSVIHSDLKTMKQSAVKMSVGQKKGASQIVQDWLDDGGDTENDDNNDSTEETSNE